MTRLESALRELLLAIARHGRRAALVGGLAVSARAEPRLTRDVDLAVAVRDDEEAERLVRSLISDGFSAGNIVEQEATRRLATVRLAVPGESARGVVGDLLFSSSGIENTIVEQAEAIEAFPGLVVPVARAGHLVALKLLSRDDRRRPQDLADLNALRRVVDTRERDRARSAIAEIERLGTSRGRDLGRALDEWLSRPRDE